MQTAIIRCREARDVSDLTGQLVVIVWRENLPRLPLLIIVATPSGVDLITHLGIETRTKRKVKWDAGWYQFGSYRTQNVTKQLHNAVSSNRTPLLPGKPDSFRDTGAAFKTFSVFALLVDLKRFPSLIRVWTMGHRMRSDRGFS